MSSPEIRVHVPIEPRRVMVALRAGVARAIHSWLLNASMPDVLDTRDPNQAMIDWINGDDGDPMTFNERHPGRRAGFIAHLVGGSDLMRGLALLAQQHPRLFADVCLGKVDNECGEVLLQMILFGGVIYDVR